MIPPGPVIDQDINISGNNQLTTPMLVHAMNANVTMNVIGTASITSTVEGANLCLQVDAGRAMFLELHFDLDFLSGPARTTPFVITHRGPGQLFITFDGGTTLSFDSGPGAVVGTWFMQRMMVGGLETRWTRINPPVNPNLDVGVFVGKNSLISYVADTSVASGTATETGIMNWDPSILLSNTGIFNLTIGDMGGVIVGGHLITTDTCPLSANDIDMSTPAGLTAEFDAVSTGGTPGVITGGLFINNQNTAYDNNLLINQFCVNTYTGLLHGFVLQANGLVQIGRSSMNVAALGQQNYIFYTGEALNTPPMPMTLVPGSNTVYWRQVTKDRNPSAFIVDGSTNPNSVPAAINIQSPGAIYFASAIDVNGTNVIFRDGADFISCLNFAADVPGAGNIVFDVEGPLTVSGLPANNTQTALNIVSLVTSTTGGPVNINGLNVAFPTRNYFTNADGTFQRFPRSSFMIHNVMTLVDTVLKHDDESHAACVSFLPDNSLVIDPQPAYIGGEVSVGDLASCQEQPFVCAFTPANTIVLDNSQIFVHTDLAASGITFQVPNLVGEDNVSQIVMYSNGRCLDNGTGRCFTLGSITGSLASDGAHVLNPSSYIDVMQTTADATLPVPVLDLNFAVGYNNGFVKQALIGQNITGQDSVEQVALLYGSNICVGTDTTTTPPPFTLTTLPILNITGNYYNFISQGGRLQDPSSGGTSGEGAIYVDSNGTFEIQPNLLAAMGVVVAKSGNGIVNLPQSQVRFGAGVGIQEWNLNLSGTTLLVPAGVTLAKYDIDWKNAKKDFCDNVTYTPYTYQITSTSGCTIPALNNPVTSANLDGIPLIEGTVGQLLLENSSIGDVAQLWVSGGTVRELVLLAGSNGLYPGFAPTATIVLDNDAFVGLGTASFDIDSTQAAMVMGLNGVTLLAQGDATVLLNQNVLIDNVAHILTGPNFGTLSSQELLITSQVPREIRVKRGGLLDLSQFSKTGKRLNIGGLVSLVFEAGSTLILGGGELFFTESAQITFEPTLTENPATDRVKIYSACLPNVVAGCNGPSHLTFKEGSRMFVPRGTVVGIETNGTGTGSTICNLGGNNQSWLVTDDARIEIGNNQEYGGALQIGNTTSDTSGNIIDWVLTVSGQNATVLIEGEGFFGFAAGVTSKPDTAPDTWLVEPLLNVSNVSIVLQEGTFSNPTIFSGSSPNASLLAFGPVSGTYSFSFNRYQSLVLGGGNMIVTTTNATPFTPAVDTVSTPSGIISPQGPTYGAGILSSTAALLDASKTTSTANTVTFSGNAQTVFTALAMNSYNTQFSHTATVANTAQGQQSIGYVYGTTIWRQVASSFKYGGQEIGGRDAVAIGAAGIAVTFTGSTPAASLAILNRN